MKTLFKLFQARDGGRLAPESPTVNEGASTSGSSSESSSDGSSGGSSESHSQSSTEDAELNWPEP